MTHKLKIKIGIHEFDAEGPEDYVSARFEDFKDLVEKFMATPAGIASTSPRATPRPSAEAGPLLPEASPVPPGPQDGAPDLKEIFRIDQEGQKLDLHAHIDDAGGKNEQTGNALLVTLYAFRKIFNMEEVGSVRTAAVLRNALGQNIRIDNAIVPLLSNGFLTKSGTGRATNYRLTFKGMAKAEAVARELVAKMR